MTTTELPAEQGARTEWNWLRDLLPPLLRLATVLTGEPALAQSLVAASLARERAGQDEFPETRLRQLVVRRYLASGAGTARDRLAHACLVLRHYEGLTLAETATVVDRPVSQVAGDLSSDELHPQQLRESLLRLADTAPGPASVLEALDGAARRTTTRRRRRLGLAVLAAAVVALLVLVPVVLLPRLPGQTRSAGDWSLVHQVRPPAGWSVVEHSISRTVESTTVRPDAGAGAAAGVCEIQVYVPGGLDLSTLPAQRDPARVHGHQAFFSNGDGLDFGPLLAFRYATDAWSLVQCPRDAQLDRTKLVSLASAVRFRTSSIELPFRLASVPPGYRVESATQGTSPTSAELILAMTEIRVGDANMAITYAPLDHPTADGEVRKMEVNGRPAFLDYASSHPRLCISAGASYICLAAYWPLGDWPARAPLPTNMGPVLVATAKQLQLVDDLGAVDTWYPGSQAIPAG